MFGYFLQTLRSSAIPSSIISRLPLTTETYGNVDDQPRSIFDSVVNRLQSAIPKSPDSLLKGDESQRILREIQGDPSTDDAKPRCNHACSRCGAPCHRHTNHEGHHDFHHQPKGLAGGRWNGSDLIVHETCHESCRRGDKMVFKDGTLHSYEEFPKLFNSEVPHSQSQRNLLSEYLLCKYHNETAEYYGIKPNPPVPTAYCDYTLEDIKAKIKKLMHPII